VRVFVCGCEDCLITEEEIKRTHFGVEKFVGYDVTDIKPVVFTTDAKGVTSIKETE
jgi:hypothetical protein